jgi:peptidoglycan DL-endopeptidase CwlO
VTPLRSSLRRLLLCVAVVALVIAPASHAHAEPTLEEVEAEIDRAWRQLEPLIEQYNRVRSELKANQELSAQLEEEIAPLELKMGIASAELEVIVARQYKGGGLSAFNSLLASGSPTTFVEQLALLDIVARDQQRRIEEHREAREEFEEQKAEIDALIEEQQAQQADLEQRTDQIERELARLENLLEEARARQQTTPDDGSGLFIGDCPAVAGSGAGATAAQFACGEIGKPYVWGTNGPDTYDCSGLTQAAWAAAGVSLTHYTGAQWNEGTPVSRADARPGDLVFFYSDLSHMGLYVGNGLMVHAPRTGDVVRMRSIDVMPIAGFRRPG